MTVIIDGTTGITNNSGTLISASTVGVGGTTPAASGAGITFPATQSASTDANTLDDYEEGTWTPTVIALSGTFTTVGACSGQYTKIGRQVNVTYTINITTLGTGAGGFEVTNLPFSVVSSTSDIPGYGVRASDGNQLVSIVNASTVRADTYLYNGGNPLVAGANYRMAIIYSTT